MNSNRMGVGAACCLAGLTVGSAGVLGAGAESALYSPEAYLHHVKYLSDDALMGRLAGSPGGIATTEYVASQFASIGLRPAGLDGTFYQPFIVRALKSFEREAAHLEIVGGADAGAVEESWAVMPFTSIGGAAGPLAFAGFGISAPDYEYDDYAGFDATGKVLLVLRGEPTRDDPDARFGGKDPSSHALFSTKARAAAERGAAALLIVNERERSDPDELYRWSDRDARQSYALPMAHISRELAGAWLEAAGLPGLDVLEDGYERCGGLSAIDVPDVFVSLETGTSRVEGRNVLGMLPGDGSTDEVIVIGAHHDHVGFVSPMMRRDAPPEIHNGADDNASGTAGVIELARALACGPPLRRNVLFMTFDAEELGLLGSKHFVEDPTIDLANIVAMINFDMIGRAENQNLTVFGTASGDTFSDELASAAEAVGLYYQAPVPAGTIFRQSDHASFYDEDIPVMFGSTMLHPQYHQPEDDWELVDSEGAVQLLEAMGRVVASIANAEEPPAFAQLEQDRSRPRDRLAAARERAADSGGARSVEGAGESRGDDAPAMPRVRLGIVPSYDDPGPGLLVQSVAPDTPAAKGGMKDGDRIVKIATSDVTDIYGYMSAVRALRPGDSAEIVVQRGPDQVTLKVTFDSQGDGRERRRE